MKRYMALLIAAGCLAGYAMAQDTNPVYSVNIVGFNKVTLQRGKLYMISTAFEDIDGKVLKSVDVFGNQVPTATTIWMWNTKKIDYDKDVKQFNGWTANITYTGGQGFWIKVPAGADPQSFEVTFMGQAPMDNVISNNIVQGLSQVGYPYTASVAFTNTSLAKKAQIGDTIYVWDPVANDYLPSIQRQFNGWAAAAKTLTIDMGKGFWFKNTKTAFWTQEPRPY